MNKKIIALIIAILVIVAGISIWFISSNNSSKQENTNNQNSSENMNESNNENLTENVNNSLENVLVDSEENIVDTNSAENNETSGSKKVAVIYFSATGTTKRVAEYIKDETYGDLIEIVPKNKYTDSDLNYNNNSSRATREQNDSSARPEISNTINTDQYDVIFLGYPIWWGDAPRIILTFLDKANLNGKTVIPFCTSGSSGIETSVNYFKNNYKNINWLDGKRLTTSQDEVKTWVNSLNY